MAKKQSGNGKDRSGGTAAQRAREHSAKLREENAKRDKRRTMLVQIGVVVVVALVLIGGTIAVLSAMDDENSGTSTTPANVTDDGSVVVGNPDAPVTLQIVEDFQCPACQSFEAAAADLLSSYAEGDDVKVEFRGISFLDQASTNRYSSRALNASACVVDEDPDNWKAFHDAMFANQPAEGGAGLTDDEILALVEDAGVERSAVEDCVTDEAFADWVESTTEASNEDGVTGTPTLFLNGELLESTDPADVQSAVDQAVAEAGR